MSFYVIEVGGIGGVGTIVGITPCKTAPRTLKTSPASQAIKKAKESPSADPRWNYRLPISVRFD